MIKLPTHKNFKNLTGLTFGRLKILSLDGKGDGKAYRWKYKCECGKTGTVLGSNISGKRSQQSCGCLAMERIKESCTTHGMSQSSEFCIWRGAKKRARLESDPAYYKYGGRGIGMSDEWYNSFEKFYSDMGPRPKRYTLERKDNNLGYSKENCIWANYVSQGRNRRSNHLIEFNGKKMCLTEWANEIGIRKDTLRRRIVNYKWPLSRALIKEVIK